MPFKSLRRLKAYHKRYNREHREEKRQYNLTYELTHKKETKARNRKYYQANRKRLIKQAKKCERARHKHYTEVDAIRHQRIKRKVMDRYGGSCACCGSKNWLFSVSIISEAEDERKSKRSGPEVFIAGS